jgi:hypothetical protein
LFFQPDLAYSIALCHYQLRHYPMALKSIADIIERGIKDHPGLITNISNTIAHMQSSVSEW